MSKIFAAVLAGGVGTRMGEVDRPKQFLEVGGKPIILHTIERFLENPDFEAVLVLTPEEWVEHTRELAKKCEKACRRITVLSGGRDRNETLMRALTYIEEHFGLSEETILVTHDAVRPLVSARIIRENIAAAAKYGACGTAIPAIDTIVKSDDGKFISEMPERSLMYQQQTPQSFRALLLKRAYETLTEEERATLTDACRILVLKGIPVYIVEGEPCNLKVTYPSDLQTVEAMLRY